MRIVTAAELHDDTSGVLQAVAEDGPVIVTDEGRPAAVVLRVSEDDLEDYLVAHSPQFLRELDEAYEECLGGAGRQAEELVTELRDGTLRARRPHGAGAHP